MSFAESVIRIILFFYNNSYYDYGVTNGRVGYYTKAQFDARYDEGYAAGVQYAKQNMSITLYLLSTKDSTTGLNAGTSITITQSNTVNSRTWGNAVASLKCPQNSEYASMLWVTGWN